MPVPDAPTVPSRTLERVDTDLQHVHLLVPQLPEIAALLPYLERIDRAHWYSNFGPLVRELETRLSQSFTDAGSADVVAVTVSNATAGLELALRALELPANAYVLVPAFTFVATATSVLSAGLTPICADVDPVSWQLTTDIADAACEILDIRAVLPVCVFGQSLPVDDWHAFYLRRNIPVVIDAAAAFGNLWDPGPTCAVFSMHATKPLSSAEGGFVATRSAAYAMAITQLSNFGINLTRPEVAPIGVSTTIGVNAKLSEYHAAVGLASLDAWASNAKRRIALFGEYAELIRVATNGKVHWPADHANSIRSVFAFQMPTSGTRRTAEALMASRQIATRRWYCPTVDQHPAFAHIEHLPITTAHDVGARILGIPFHLSLDAISMRRVADAIGSSVA